MQSDLPREVKSERNPGKRSEIAIDLAAKALDQARTDYDKGDAAQGDSQLDEVGMLADACLDAARESRKQRYLKHAEQRTAMLARRVRGLIDDLSFDERDKAQRLASQLDAIHDKLLAGVMGK